jgi:hypothetical protein
MARLELVRREHAQQLAVGGMQFDCGGVLSLLQLST